jgi:hypothetical protein
MDYVFPALKRAFDADPEATLAGRMLYHGILDEPRNVRNYVECECEDVNHDLDAFESEEPVYTIRFVVYSKSGRADSCARILKALERVFHNGLIVSPHFTCSGMEMRNGSGPKMVDGVFQGEWTMTLHAYRSTRLSATQAGVHG